MTTARGVLLAFRRLSVAVCYGFLRAGIPTVLVVHDALGPIADFTNDNSGGSYFQFGCDGF
ncbi:MAG: hypothetical protein Q4A82_08050 [Corynebacterium sp.]|nr:hypothetical protein [Corynebacterium sp.]